MATKIKLFSLENEGDDPEFIGPIDMEEGQSFALLRVKLEEVGVIEWPFQFWDASESCRIRPRLERLNTVQPTMYVIPVTIESNDRQKRMRIADASFVNDSEQIFVAEGALSEGPSPVMVDPVSTNPETSRVSGSDEVHDSPALLSSTLIPREVMDWYLRAEEKLRKELNQIALEDHSWSLRSWDESGVGIVKLYCDECRKDFGSNTGEHTKPGVTNLFANFKKSHIMSLSHIKNWCRKKGVDFYNHPQSAVKGKAVILTVEDHRRLVKEGAQILEVVNTSANSDRPPFLLIGDPESADVKSFWFKVKCSFCGDIFQLCPPKKNLEANLRNHLNGTKHHKVMEDFEATVMAQGSALSSGRRGRPAKSSGGSTALNQKSLHSWYKNSTSSAEGGESRTWDRSFLLSCMCWGLRGPTCDYGGKSYVIDGLLQDIHPGQQWYPEPYVEAEFEVDGKVVLVKGTFRHRNCSRFSISGDPFPDFACSMCSKIPAEGDFRLRVLREDKALEKRGMRGSMQGRRIGFLSVLEMSGHIRLTNKKYHVERMKRWVGKARIAQLRVKRPSLLQSAKQASEQHNVLKFCNNIIAAHRTGAFGGKPALWDFMRDVASNLNRKKRGYRFSVNTKSFGQAMRVYGGRRMCDLFALNFGGPALCTTKREDRKGVQFVAGEHEEIFASVAQIYRDAKVANGIEGPVPVILAEDETKIKGRVAYEQRWDSLAGFCGHKEDHVCMSKYKPKVGTGEEGYAKIVDCFRSDRIGGFARVIMVNPLHEKLPRLVLQVNCTCNCFDATWVRRQWGIIDGLWLKECHDAVGPVVGHASDGDSRRRLLMLADYKSQEGSRFKLDWEGWLLSGSLQESGEVQGLHDQDWIHNGKKLVNPLDSSVRVLQLGTDVALLTHLGQVFNKFTIDEHGLKLEDVNRTDRQNWASAQRLCQSKARCCLQKLRTSNEVHKERTLGTEMYLNICADYIDIFASPRLDLRSRIVLAGKVSFFFRIWKLWFTHGDHRVGSSSKTFTTKENFISMQCFVDIQLSCHFVVLLICHFHDKYPHLQVPLHLTGSDSCEIFFSKIGGMVGLEKAYDFHELVNTANTINRLAGIEFGENGLQFGRMHNKMKNVWADLHPLVEGEQSCDLGNYSGIASDGEVILALQEGLKEAQKILRSLSMAPSSVVRKKDWFLAPWKEEKHDPKHLVAVQSKRMVAGEDGDGEVLREALSESSGGVEEGSNPNPELANSLVVDDVDEVEEVPVLEEETRDILSEMMNEHEVQIQSDQVKKVIPVVTYDGHSIYKSTLVSQLNGNPFLSKDRLTRVRNSMYFNNSDDYLSAASSDTTMLCGLGSDVGVYFVQRASTSSAVQAARKRTRGRPSRINQGVDEGIFYIGRVQKMRRRSGSKWGPCRQAIDLQNRAVQVGIKSGLSPTTEILLNWFSKAPGHLKFKYDASDCVWIDVDTVISTVTMSYNSGTKIYSLDDVDAASLQEFVNSK